MKYSDLFRTAAAVAVSIAMAAVPAVAKSGNPKVKPTVAKAKPTSAGPKAKAPKALAPKAKAQTPKGQAKAPKAASLTGTTKSKTKSASTKGSTTKANKDADGRQADSLTDFADNTPSQPLSKAQEKLLSNMELARRLRLRLGSDPMAAAAGFRNLGQFVAAVNISNNLGISFTLLKSLMVDRGMSLGQAIQQAKTLEAPRALSLANTALVQANDEITATSLTGAAAAKKVKDKS